MTQRSYRIALASQISGVKEELIRQWERRYGVLNPERTPGGYRTYSDADIEVLKRLQAKSEVVKETVHSPEVNRRILHLTASKIRWNNFRAQVLFE